MAKILCAKSGLEINVQYFPISLSSRECSHPIFSAPQKKLLGYAGKWAAGELTPTDSYLLFLALLNSTDLVEFRVAARKNDGTVAANMEDCLKVIGAINCISHPSLNLPHFVVSPETSSLNSVHFWIEVWKQSVEDFKTGNRNESLREKLVKRENSLNRLIRDPQRDINSYAGSLAEWAAMAGSFPSGSPIPTPLGSLTLAEYWKQIIKRCGKTESLYAIPEKDLDELIEHCEDNIMHGSIAAHTLMQYLRTGRQKQGNLWGLGDIDIKSGTYQILSESSTVEDANIISLIQSAPITEPRITDYDSRLAYLKARSKWELAQRHRNQGESE